MNVPLPPLLVAGAVLLLLTALLAALETVIDRLNVVRALRLAEEDRRGARKLLWLTEHRVTSLNVLLVLGVAVRMLLGACAVLAGWQVANGTGAGVALVVAVVVVLVLGEVAPRTIVLRHLESTGLRLSGPASALVRVLDPVARAAVSLGRAVVPRRHEVSGPYATDDELRQLDADEEEQDEELEPEERAMIRSIFELADTIVREIMVPRPDMVTVPENAPLTEIVRVVLEGGYSRVPVHDPEDADTIVGVVYAKDLLRRVATERRRERWGDLVRRPTFVPETKRCDELLRELQEATVHLAIVVDEYGETVGLVTIEDILEEIVGEIVDEHDHEEPLVELLDDDVMRIDARLGVDDLNELLDADLPEEGWDTVGGLVFGTLGRVPVEGERLELEGLCITVERVQGRRVGKVLVSRVGADEEAAESAGDLTP
ncbi:hemolysin family protein [Egicoccus sp. AB-alg6-2]|uniref:hemolysin family protein n=1 Tax=Egicoccus sp. AB-alg6-2 TaxID=3242692 RepID=UPI00359F09B0